MPIFQDPQSPIGRSLPLIPTDITRLRKGANDSFVADKAYNLDPQFRSLADHYFKPEINSQLDEETKKKLPTMLLNMHYFGKPVLEEDDDLTAELSKPAQKGIFSQMSDYLQAPAEAATGIALKGIAGITGSEKIAGAREVRKLPENILKTGELAPAAGMMIGSAAGPLGSAAGAFAGQGIKQLTQSIAGTNEMTPTEQIIEPVKEGAIAGTVDYGLGLAGKGIKAVSKKPIAAVEKWLSEKIPSRITNSIIKPLSKEFEFGKNPGQAIVDEGIVAPTRGSLAQKVTARKQEIGKMLYEPINAASVGNAKKQIDMEPLIVNPIREAMMEAKKRGETAYFNQLQDLLDGMTKEFVEAGRTITPKGEKGLIVTPLEAWLEKQNIGNSIRWTGQAFDNDLNQVKYKIFSNFKKALIEAVPESKTLFSRYANILGAEKSIERQIALLERQNILSFGQTTLGGVAAIGSLATGDSTPEALAKGAVAGALLKGAGSPAVKTLAAQGIKQLPKVAQGIAQNFAKLEPSAKAALYEYISSLINPQKPDTTQ